MLSAQQAPTAPAESIAVAAAKLPRVILRQTYHFPLAAQGGVTPYVWELASGSLPPGLELERNGMISGVTAATGKFAFQVAVSDSAKPPHHSSQQFELVVVEALTAEWKRPPQINAGKIEGSIRITNGTEDDFDLTVIVEAVNEIGKAFAIGYQHFPLKKDTADFEIPFGDNLPSGTYTVNAAVVGEVASKKAIFRARLATPQPLKMMP